MKYYEACKIAEGQNLTYSYEIINYALNYIKDNYHFNVMSFEIAELMDDCRKNYNIRFANCGHAIYSIKSVCDICESARSKGSGQHGLQGQRRKQKVDEEEVNRVA